MKPYEFRTDPDLRLHARILDASTDYRVLRRLPVADEMWLMPTPSQGTDITLAVIDTETTGLAETDRVIEIAVAKLRLVDGQIADLTTPLTMLEDPGRPLTAEIRRITGLTDGDVAGQTFDEHRLRHELADVDALVAFNAKFDALHLRRRFPWLLHPWICARADYDWAAAGHPGRGQEALLNSVGHFLYTAHRAGPDTWALVVLLAQPAWDGRTVAAHLVERGREEDTRVSAVDAPFAVKDALKARGYRWHAVTRVWRIDVSAAAASDEVAALMALHPLIRPMTQHVDWYDRHIS